MDAAARQITLQTDYRRSRGHGGPQSQSGPRSARRHQFDQRRAHRTHRYQRGRPAARTRPHGGRQKSLAALEIVVISQSDIASKQAAERADWDRRGATGIVADVAADSFTINVRTIEGVKPVIVKPAANAVMRRYTPDSVKFADAKPSQLSEIRKGDQVRARGNKTPDGSQMTADEIVSGQFKMIAGLVLSVDPQENVVRINNIETKKPMTVKISADSRSRNCNRVGASDCQSFAWCAAGRRPPGARPARRWPGGGPAAAAEDPADSAADAPAICNR